MAKQRRIWSWKHRRYLRVPTTSYALDGFARLWLGLTPRQHSHFPETDAGFSRRKTRLFRIRDKQQELHS